MKKPQYKATILARFDEQKKVRLEAIADASPLLNVSDLIRLAVDDALIRWERDGVKIPTVKPKQNGGKTCQA